MHLQEIKEIIIKYGKSDQNITIGLTGGIGSGKSVVARILRCQGFPVYDCDSEAKRLMIEDVKVVNDLKNTVGRNVYFPDGELNKGYLSKRLFSEIDIRRKVNSIVHTAVRNDIDLKRHKIKGPFIIESAILKSSRIDRMCDEIWIVETSEEERLERIIKRDRLTKEDIEKRIKSQQQEYEGFENNKVFKLRNDSLHQLLLPVLELICRR